MIQKQLNRCHNFINDVVAVAEPGATFDVFIERYVFTDAHHVLTRAQLRILHPARVERDLNVFVDIYIEPLDLGYQLPCTAIHYGRVVLMGENPHDLQEQENGYRYRIDFYNDRLSIGHAFAIVPVGRIKQPTIDCLMSFVDIEMLNRIEELDRIRKAKKERELKLKEYLKTKETSMTAEERRRFVRKYYRDHMILGDENYLRRRWKLRNTIYRIIFRFERIP